MRRHLLGLVALGLVGCGPTTPIPAIPVPGSDGPPASGGTGGGSTGGAGGGAAGAVDAGAACSAFDCANQPITDVACADRTLPKYTCDRGPDGACHRSPPRCPPLPDAGADAAGGVACGSKQCPAGQVCCNPSCGVCTPPGAACVAIACPPGPGPGAQCRTDADCRLFDDYCMGCACRALGRNDPDPTCSGTTVKCLRQPCADHAAACNAGRCVVAAAGTRWALTCGVGIVCPGWQAKPDVPLCTTEKAGEACPTAGLTCDPKDPCNRLLRCQASGAPMVCPR